MRKLLTAISLGMVVVAGTRTAMAGLGPSIAGPNSDFPDVDLVMPFDAAGPRTTFFAVSNIGPNTFDATWFFYDESGELITQATRTILSNGGTDIVDATRVGDRSPSGDGGFVEGPTISLAGRRGFVVVAGRHDPERTRDLFGNFTIANTETNAAFGSSAAGMGLIGGLSVGSGISGTTFNPSQLQDNELIILGLNIALKSGGAVTSLTDGLAPTAGTSTFVVSLELHGNSGDGLIASGSVSLTGTALFTSLQDFFPGTNLNGSATIAAFGDEGADYTGGPSDPDEDTTVAIIGWYGQTLGAFGAGQNLRTLE